MSMDIKARKEAEHVLRESEARLQGLVGELQHRVRNILTVVRSVFSRTVEGERPIEEIAEHFRGRLDSLARTQVILAQHPAGSIDLQNLIRDELINAGVQDRSEERRVGKEGGSTCRSRWSPYHEKTKQTKKYKV